MPHLILDYAAELEQHLDMRDCLDQLFATMAAHPAFEDPETIKLRAAPWPHHRTGTGTGSFAHATVRLMAGRSPEAKKTLSTQIIDTMRRALPGVHSLTCEIRDMDRASYGKHLQ